MKVKDYFEVCWTPSPSKRIMFAFGTSSKHQLLEYRLDSGPDSRVPTSGMAQAAHTFRIGELAEQSGLTPDTLRYYERRGLLVRPRRSPGGFRLYSPDTLDRLHFIRHAQAVGLTLDDIGTLLSFNGKRGLIHCQRVNELLAARLADLDRKIKGLTAFRRTLQTHLRTCEEAMNTQTNPRCPVVDDLAGGKKRKPLDRN